MVDKSITSPKSKEYDYLDYVNPVRVLLIVLVLTHHSVKPYIVRSNHELQLPYPLITEGSGFLWLNALFLMAVFFFFSAYFIPGSYSRHGLIGYMGDRLRRLDLPLLIGFLVFVPLEVWFRYSVSGLPPLDYWTYYTQDFLGFGTRPEYWPPNILWPEIQLGRFWFVEHLSIYSLLYVLYRILASAFNIKLRTPQKSEMKAPDNITIIVFCIGLSIFLFVFRQTFPVNDWTAYFGFIQTETGRVPQYILFFLIGLYAGPHRWLQAMPRKSGLVWMTLGAIMSVIAILSGFAPEFDPNSLAACLFESFLCTALCIGLPVAFREANIGSHAIWKTLNSNVFALYIFHYPVVLGTQYLLADAPFSPWFRMISTIVIVLSGTFLFTNYVILRTPYIRRLF